MKAPEVTLRGFRFVSTWIHFFSVVSIAHNTACIKCGLFPEHRLFSQVFTPASTADRTGVPKRTAGA